MNIKKLRILDILITTIIVALIVVFYAPYKGKNINLNMNIQSSTDADVKVYYVINDEAFSEDQTVTATINKGDNEVSLSLPNTVRALRIDLGEDDDQTFTLSNMSVTYKNNVIVDSDVLDIHKKVGCKVKKDSQEYKVTTIKVDPNIIVGTDKWQVHTYISSELSHYNMYLKALASFIVVLVGLFVFKKIEIFTMFPIEILSNKTLVMQLAKNDFKTKFAGSYLGTFWAFVQPVVTVLVYWFVFQVGLRSSGVGDIPFVLWLVAGIVPWFYFSDALNGGTNALIEYQYLVKKVVFQIDILPFVKILSALFVHIFFVGFTLFLYCCYGYFPTIYTIQILYYSICLTIFVLGLCYMTSAIVGFFRDLTQIIGIVLQIGIWVTPILWNIETIGAPSIVKVIFKLNPIYYITSGYRDALIYHTWFFQKPTLTLYFWIVTILMFGLGSLIFKRLKVHFADVL